MRTREVAGRPVPGLDVGRQSQRAPLLGPDGEVRLDRSVANRERDLDGPLGGPGPGAPEAAARCRSMGAPAIAKAMRAGLDVACLPGIAAHP